MRTEKEMRKVEEESSDEPSFDGQGNIFLFGTITLIILIGLMLFAVITLHR
jgi:uncharacterized membrane protein